MIRSRVGSPRIATTEIDLALRPIIRQIQSPVIANDIEITEIGKGIILVDELGKKWRVTINSLGNLVQTPL